MPPLPINFKLAVTDDSDGENVNVVMSAGHRISDAGIGYQYTHLGELAMTPDEYNTFVDALNRGTKRPSALLVEDSRKAKL